MEALKANVPPKQLNQACVKQNQREIHKVSSLSFNIFVLLTDLAFLYVSG